MQPINHWLPPQWPRFQQPRVVAAAPRRLRLPPARHAVHLGRARRRGGRLSGCRHREQHQQGQVRGRGGGGAAAQPRRQVLAQPPSCRRLAPWCGVYCDESWGNLTQWYGLYQSDVNVLQAVFRLLRYWRWATDDNIIPHMTSTPAFL